MALDEFAQSRIDASGYADAYREDPKAADAFKKGQQSKWIDALRARAEEGPNFRCCTRRFCRAIRNARPSSGVSRSIGKKASKAISHQRSETARSERRQKRHKNQPWEMTWEEYRKKATPDGVPDKAAKNARLLEIAQEPA